MSDATEEDFVEESSRLFRRLVDWASDCRDTAAAIVWVGAKVKLTESQARRVYDANLKSISTGKYARIANLHGEHEAIEARKTEMLRQIAQNRRGRGLHAIDVAQTQEAVREGDVLGEQLVRRVGRCG